MAIKPLGKIVLLMLAIGIAIGGWRLYQRIGGTLPDALALKSSAPSSSASPDTGAGGTVEIPFIITAAKKDWVQEEVDHFNQEHAGQWRITTKAEPSREAMHSILSGQEQPVLWSPGSPIWPSRLAEAWAEKNPDKILDMADPTAYRVYLRSPLVFLTTKNKASFLRDRLSKAGAWDKLRRLSMQQDKAPWGTFRWSHADPVTSSSGILTLGLVLMEFSDHNGLSGSLDKAADDPRFVSYIKELDRSLVYDGAAEAGTTALSKSFIEDPSRYDIITAYESAALDAAPKHPDLAVIYPNPTLVAEHAISLLSGKWVTDAQRQGATAFLTFLGSKAAIQDGMKYHFRPAQAGGALTLAGELSKYQSQGFQQSFTTAELPPYQALNAAAFQWRIQVLHKPPDDL